MKPALIVIDPGPFATLQDLGRHGYQRYGVSGSGAMDEVSLRIANMLVGNPLGEAAVEFTFSGGIWEVACSSCRVAVAGDFPMRIDDVPAPAFTSHMLRRGSRLAIGRAASGLRGYLAVAGGFDIAPVLGSLSTHTRAGFGGFEGGALKPGARLPLRHDAAEAPDLAFGAPDWPNRGECVRVVLGPQDDYFTQDGLRTFLETPYTITAQSDRMGCRLEGAPIEHCGDYNIISDGIVAGSIQVPGSRQPTILLADRQPTGGYPKIATAISADLPALAQKRPGEVVRFAAVSQEEAEELRIRMLDGTERLRERLRPVLPRHSLPSSELLLATNLISGVVADSPIEEGR